MKQKTSSNKKAGIIFSGVCVGLVVLLSVVIYNYQRTSENLKQVSENLQPLVTPTPIEFDNQPQTQEQTGQTVTSSNVEVEEEAAQPTPTDEAVETWGKKAEKPKELKKPVDGDIIKEFSMDKLLYSKTLGDWRTHSGIDIAGNTGDKVYAAYDGTVKDIYNDPKYGITIVLDHQNNFKTIYSNLLSDNVVSVGQKVKQGDVISGIGETAMFEVSDEPHLHFEVSDNDKLLNPAEFFK